MALPTETVYGLAADAGNPEALKRLRSAKKRPDGKPFALLLASADGAFRHAAEVPPLAHRLMRAFWPGPLTLVLPAKGGGTVGLRVPALRLTRDILRLSGRDVAASSANPSGGPEPRDAGEVVAGLGDAVDLVVDAGSVLLGKASTVVAVRRDGHEVLREGVLPRAEVDRHAYTGVLFVCSGNTCRSPMAAALMEQALARRLGTAPEGLAEAGFRVESAGTGGFGGAPASEDAVAAMDEAGADLSGHRSRAVTATLVDEADFVYVMTRRHRNAIHDFSVADPDRIRLADPGGRDVSDPLGGGLEEYRRTRERLRVAVEARAEEVLASRRRPDGGAP
ncbi:MAG: L-threonylcarbamoyladenylate synthase [Planctomycetes bacterium]|nr:L-threonylcarbamoyladenylate synthase [Planctomycetota bacterium]